MIAVRNWLSRPDNNRYNRTYLVPEDWDRTPDNGPHLLADVCTDRDVYSFLTTVFGEENVSDDVNLPENWANNNPDTLRAYVDLENIPPELRTFLQYDG